MRILPLTLRRSVSMTRLFIQRSSGPLADRKIPMIPLLREKAMAAFREWQAKTDKAPY